MPYSKDNLPDNIKKLPQDLQDQWLAVFNSSFAKCQEDEGEDCEAFAFRNANGVIKKRQESPKAQALRNDESLDDRIRKVRDAWYAQFHNFPNIPVPAIAEANFWVAEVFEDSVILETPDGNWRANYSASDTNEIVFDDRNNWVKVEQTWQEVTASLSASEDGDYDTSPWDAGAVRKALSIEDLRKVCLLDLNGYEGQDEPIKDLCYLPLRSSPGSKVNKNALRSTASGARGISAIKRPEVVPESYFGSKLKQAASSIISMWNGAFGANAPESIYKVAGKSRPRQDSQYIHKNDIDRFLASGSRTLISRHHHTYAPLAAIGTSKDDTRAIAAAFTPRRIPRTRFSELPISKSQREDRFPGAKDLWLHDIIMVDTNNDSHIYTLDVAHMCPWYLDANDTAIDVGLALEVLAKHYHLGIFPDSLIKEKAADLAERASRDNLLLMFKHFTWQDAIARLTADVDALRLMPRVLAESDLPVADSIASMPEKARQALHRNIHISRWMGVNLEQFSSLHDSLLATGIKCIYSETEPPPPPPPDDDDDSNTSTLSTMVSSSDNKVTITITGFSTSDTDDPEKPQSSPPSPEED